MTLAYSLNDNEPEFPVLTESEYPETVIAEPVYSFKICGGEALTDETIQNLELLVRMYEADDTDPEEIWSVIPFTDNGFGMWTIEFSEELVKREKWKQENKRITFEMEIQGTDQEGDFVHFNNGDNLYKITFTCDDADGIQEMKNEELRMKYEEPVYNLGGQRLSKLQKGINIVGGKKVLR